MVKKEKDDADWFGRYIMRGFKFLVALPFVEIKEIKRKRCLNGIGKETGGSSCLKLSS